MRCNAIYCRCCSQGLRLRALTEVLSEESFLRPRLALCSQTSTGGIFLL